MPALQFALLFLATTASIVLGSAYLFTSEVPGVLLALALGVALLSATRLSWGVLVAIFLAPVMGNRPGSPQAEVLFLLSAAFQLGSLYPITKLQRGRGQPPSTLWILLTFYTAVSCLSLLGIPFIDWWRDVRAHVPAFRDISALTYYLGGIATSTEERLSYILLSVYWTICAWQLALACLLLVRADAVRSVQLWWSIQASLLTALLVGLLDYYGAVDLRQLRSLDPIVNPDDIQFRLQSWFGHSGWFAEFITLAAPSVMIWLSVRRPFFLRVVAIVSALLLGEFVLLLTFQRGGWLSYPLTLLFVWAAIYVTRQLERGEVSALLALRKSVVKILLSLPITLAASLAVLWAIHHYTESNSGTGLFTRYFERAKDITKTSDRSDFWRAGVLLGLRQPILGGGSESFAYQYRREFRNPAGAYAGRIDLPLHGTAHNVYAQTFSGKGLLGLSLLLGVLGVLFLSPLRLCLTQSSTDSSARIALLAGSASAAAFAIYGNVQELFYVQSLQLLFFAIVGATAALLPPRIKPGLSKTLVLVCLMSAVAHLAWQYLLPGSVRLRPSAFEQYGCYSVEGAPDNLFTWCGPRAQLMTSEDRSVLSVEAAPFQTQGQTLALQVLTPSGSVSTSLLQPGKRSSINLNNHRGELVELRVGGCFIPARDAPPSTDRRCLAFRLWEPPSERY